MLVKSNVLYCRAQWVITVEKSVISSQDELYFKHIIKKKTNRDCHPRQLQSPTHLQKNKNIEGELLSMTCMCYEFIFKSKTGIFMHVIFMSNYSNFALSLNGSRSAHVCRREGELLGYLENS